MPEATGTTTQARAARFSLNSDGQRHPLLNVVAAVTCCAGIAAFALGLIVADHLYATIIGMAAFGAGLGAQMVSATREERMFIVTGIVAGFVGMGLGIAHGGF